MQKLFAIFVIFQSGYKITIAFFIRFFCLFSITDDWKTVDPHLMLII